MNDDVPYSLASAREASDQHRLADWVAGFLASPGSDNQDLAQHLSQKLGWWIGPLEVPIDRLNRLAGPKGDPVLCPVDDEDWDLGDLPDRVKQGWDPPPVIVSYRQDRLVLEDGNHRAESVRRAGKKMVWAIIGFENPDAHAHFTRQLT